MALPSPLPPPPLQGDSEANERLRKPGTSSVMSLDQHRSYETGFQRPRGFCLHEETWPR